MNLSDIRARLARPERQTGRHRGEPRYRWGLPLFFLGAVGLLFSVIITAFIVWNSPEQAVMPAQYHPSSGAVIPKPVVFPPVRQQPTPAASTYTVVARDTLWNIAYRECGDGRDWVQLQRANGINPWIIQPGQVLRIACS